MESFEKHWKLALAISCETIGFLGIFLTLLFFGAPILYLSSVLGDILFIASLALFLFGLGMLIVPLFQKITTKFAHSYEDRVRSNDKNDH